MDGWNFLSSLHPYQDVSFHPQSGKNVTACEEMSPALGFPNRGAEVRLLTPYGLKGIASGSVQLRNPQNEIKKI